MHHISSVCINALILFVFILTFFLFLVGSYELDSHTYSCYATIYFSYFQLKDFLKKCKVGNFTKQVKQIVEKLDENCKYITNRRRSATISLSDTKAIVSSDCSIYRVGGHGWAMGLGNLQCQGVLLIWIIVGQGHTVLAVGAVWFGFGNFSFGFHFFFPLYG